MSLRRRRKSGTALAVEHPARKLWQVVMTGLVMAFFVIIMAVVGPRPAASAEGVALGYEGYLGGLHLMSAEVEIVRNEKTPNGNHRRGAWPRRLDPGLTEQDRD